MWKQLLRWSLIVAAATYVSGVALHLSRPVLPGRWSSQIVLVLASLKVVVGISLLLALSAYLMDVLSPPQARPFVADDRFWLRAVFALGAANFLAFVFVAAALGGDALNGYVDRGHYFFVNRGVVTEVSQAVFTYSKWHAISTFITHPLAILAAWGLYWYSGQNSD